MTMINYTFADNDKIYIPMEYEIIEHIKEPLLLNDHASKKGFQTGECTKQSKLLLNIPYQQVICFEQLYGMYDEIFEDPVDLIEEFRLEPDMMYLCSLLKYERKITICIYKTPGERPTAEINQGFYVNDLDILKYVMKQKTKDKSATISICKSNENCMKKVTLDECRRYLKKHPIRMFN